MPQVRGKQIEDNGVTSTQADTTNGTISTVEGGDSAAEGSGTGLSRRDHQHAVSSAAPAATGVATASSEGSATTLARSDHAHQSNTSPANVTKAAAEIGTSGEPARADHKHDSTTAAPVATGTALAEGTSTSLARADHVHTVGEVKTPYFTEYNFGTGDGTDDIDWGTNGLRQRITLGANTTFTFTAPPGHCNLLLKVIKPATEYTVAWPASVEWGDDGAPDMSGTSRTHICTFYYDGATYYGAYKLGYTP